MNAIYYAIDDPLRAKSYDWGEDAMVGKKSQDGLLMITGPLTTNWRQRKLGLSVQSRWPRTGGRGPEGGGWNGGAQRSSSGRASSA